MDKARKPNEKLQRERELKGWSQEKLADEVGTTQKIVSRWECGISKLQPYYREKLVELFSKNAEELGLIGQEVGSEVPAVPSGKMAEVPDILPEYSPIQHTESADLDGGQPIQLISSHDTPHVVTIHIHQHTAVPTSIDPELDGIMDESNILAQEGTRETKGIVNRRDALREIAGAGLTIVTAPIEFMNFQSWKQFSDAVVKPARIDPITLSHFEDLIKTCSYLSMGGELEVAEQTLWVYLPRIVTLAKQSSAHQHVTAGAASKGYLLAASLAGHRDDLKVRKSLSEQALLYGNLARDRNVQVSALRQLSLTYDYMERPGKALEAYQQALPYLDQASPLLRSRMYAGLSGAYAQRGQLQEALHCLGLAHESFPENPEDDPSYLHADTDFFTLILWDGLTHLDLNQPNEAWKAFTRIDGLHPKVKNLPAKVRIEFLNYQAETLTALGEMEQGCTYLEEAVKVSLLLGSERRYSESFDVYKKMRTAWRHEPRIKALGGIFVR